MQFWKREEKREMAQVYDTDTHVITTIPAAELAPGMIRITLSGQEGVFWADASKLKQGHHQHPPFSEQVRDILRNIEQTFREVHPLSLAQWEDGFRRDMNAEREIALWMHISQVYSQVLGERELPLAYQQDILHVLVSCLNNPRDKVLALVDLQQMSKQDAEAVMRAFYDQ